MRALFLLLMVACAPADVQGDVPDAVEPVVDEPVHPCTAAAHVALSTDDPWTPHELQACMAGCEAGDEQGYEQGRLVCIVGGEFCPECVAEQDDPAYSTGFLACFRETYVDGFESEGCEVPDL
ncbi:MAG: hypothetical protein ACI9MC_001879 [Kiritimatiellia bacterium]|jgi:hypothetical protein